MTKQNVMITLRTSRIEVSDELFDEEKAAHRTKPIDVLCAPLPEPTDLLVEGRLIAGKDRVELVYDEGELSGMAGSVTAIGFDRATPGFVSMMRTGTVHTALLFEADKRHFSVYDTPFSSFQVCIRTLEIDNRLLTQGYLLLDYLVEIHGAQAERCRMTISVKPSEPLFPEE